MSNTLERLATPGFLSAAFEEISAANQAKAEAAAKERERRDWCNSFSSRARRLLDTKDTTYTYEGKNPSGYPYGRRWETNEVTVGEGEDTIKLNLVGEIPDMYRSQPYQFAINSSYGEIKGKRLFYVDESRCVDWQDRQLDTPEQRQQADEALDLFESLPPRK